MNLVLLLAEVTMTTALALAAVHLARNSRAAVRHLVLSAAFVLLAVLPLASIAAPSLGVSVPIPLGVAEDSMLLTVDETDRQRPPASAAGTLVEVSARVTPLPTATGLATGAWGFGAALFLVPCLIGLLRTRALRRSGRSWARGQSLVDAAAADASIQRRVTLLVDHALPGPMTCGVFRPTIVLPGDAHDWTQEDLQRALVHELEHVRRGDWISQAIVRVICAAYWFHPLVWIARRQLELEAERACDDAVLPKTDPTAYADQLVTLAERLNHSAAPAFLGMANRGDLATRVRAVLDSRQRRGRAGMMWIGAVAVAAALLLATVSPLRIVARAQTPAAQAPAQATSATPQRYDAATIKRCEAEENPTGARGTAGGTNATFSPGRFFVPCVTTEQLIYLAYASYGATEAEGLMNDDRGTASNATKIRGGPAWVHSLSEKYSIEATAAGATERTVLMGAMLRTLLEERFRLKLHRDTEEVPMYALTVAKGGFKLKPMKEGDCDPTAPISADLTGQKPRCGLLNMSLIEGGKTRWTFNGFDLSNLAGRLSSVLKTHVIDKTNIAGSFIYHFDFLRDPDAVITEASVLTEVEAQLGLKLESIKGPRGFIVIDAIERPTPDEAEEIPSRARGAGR